MSRPSEPSDAWLDPGPLRGRAAYASFKDDRQRPFTLADNVRSQAASWSDSFAQPGQHELADCLEARILDGGRGLRGPQKSRHASHHKLGTEEQPVDRRLAKDPLFDAALDDPTNKRKRIAGQAAPVGFGESRNSASAARNPYSFAVVSDPQELAVSPIGVPEDTENSFYRVIGSRCGIEMAQLRQYLDGKIDKQPRVDIVLAPKVVVERAFRSSAAAAI